jgi:hypothetical protein
MYYPWIRGSAYIYMFIVIFITLTFVSGCIVHILWSSYVVLSWLYLVCVVCMVCDHELSVLGTVTLYLHTSFFCVFSCNEVKQGIGH